MQGCLGANQKQEVLLAILDTEGPPREGQPRRRSVGIGETATFTCSRCSKHPECFVCHKGKIAVGEVDQLTTGGAKGSSEMASMDIKGMDRANGSEPSAALLFRCLRCKQAVHYEHCKQGGRFRFRADLGYSEVSRRSKTQHN